MAHIGIPQGIAVSRIAHPVLRPQPLPLLYPQGKPVAIPESAKHDCVLQKMDLRSLATKEFVADQHRAGYQDESYVWVVGWCTPVQEPPLKNVGSLADPCDFDGGAP